MSAQVLVQETITRFQPEETTVVSHNMERGQESFKIDDAEALRKGKVNDNVLIALVKQLLAYRDYPGHCPVKRYAHCV